MAEEKRKNPLYDRKPKEADERKPEKGSDSEDSGRRPKHEVKDKPDGDNDEVKSLPSDSGSGDGGMLKQHAKERADMHASHETERRDMHGNHREDFRKMHARHEADHKAAGEGDMLSLTRVHRKHEQERHALHHKHKMSHNEMLNRHHADHTALHARHEAEMTGGPAPEMVGGQQEPGGESAPAQDNQVAAAPVTPAPGA